jgi:hypothetical protein
MDSVGHANPPWPSDAAGGNRSSTMHKPGGLTAARLAVEELVPDVD